MENNPIPLKTSNCFNYHDFIHTESGTMEELTVEIALAEYRELVAKAATNDAMLGQIGRDYAKLSEKYGNAQASMAELEKALMEEKNNRELYLKNNAHLCETIALIRDEANSLREQLKEARKGEEWVKEENP